ncbi:MAG: hypothetical protein ACP5TJ_00550 [Candidatus Micrarchaeia archaeon]
MPVHESENEELKRYNQLYLDIIMRYKDYIEENENLSVAQLPTLVTPDDPAIVSFANTLKTKYTNYLFDKNFYEAAKQAHKYVNESIAKAVLPIEFWLKPSETLAAKAGDTLDKATLLCSILIALGNSTSKIIISTSDSTRQVGVYCEFNGKLLYFDIDGGFSEFSTKEELLESLGIGNGKAEAAYEFNNHMYNDLA